MAHERLRRLRALWRCWCRAIRARKEGYFDGIQQVEVTAHASLSFELSARPVTKYAGVYTLIITARSCSPGVPEEARRRVYTARVEQTVFDLRVSVSGANFLLRSGVFAGTVKPTGEIGFTIRPPSIWDYDGLDLVERLSDGTTLVTLGTISGASSTEGISGTAIGQEAGLGGV